MNRGDQALNGFRAALSRWVVSPLQGITFREWYRIVTDPRKTIHPQYWPRALATGLGSLTNSFQARREERKFGERIRSTEVKAPVFILGHYRNGTTHLHNLLAVDPRFAFPNYYQATFPRTFLTTEGLGSRLAFLSLSKRPHDDVALGLDVPAEDEIALCAQTLLSPHMGWHFPADESRYRKYLDFNEAAPEERERWKKAFTLFARKLTLKHERPLVFKSPCHTARVRLILETFPDARFVHIHRDPFTVFQSTRHMERKVGPLFQFQSRDFTDLDDQILWRYRTMYVAFLKDSDLIPAGRLLELSYEHLTSDPLGALREIYTGLDFPDFAEVRPLVERYLAQLAGYENNRYGRLEPATMERIRHEWNPFFAEWSYSAGDRMQASSAGV